MGATSDFVENFKKFHDGSLTDEGFTVLVNAATIIEKEVKPNKANKDFLDSSHVVIKLSQEHGGNYSLVKQTLSLETLSESAAYSVAKRIKKEGYGYISDGIAANCDFYIAKWYDYSSKLYGDPIARIFLDILNIHSSRYGNGAQLSQVLSWGNTIFPNLLSDITHSPIAMLYDDWSQWKMVFANNLDQSLLEFSSLPKLALFLGQIGTSVLREDSVYSVLADMSWKTLFLYQSKGLRDLVQGKFTLECMTQGGLILEGILSILFRIYEYSARKVLLNVDDSSNLEKLSINLEELSILQKAHYHLQKSRHYITRHVFFGDAKNPYLEREYYYKIKDLSIAIPTTILSLGLGSYGFALLFIVRPLYRLYIFPGYYKECAYDEMMKNVDRYLKTNQIEKAEETIDRLKKNIMESHKDLNYQFSDSNIVNNAKALVLGYEYKKDFECFYQEEHQSTEQYDRLVRATDFQKTADNIYMFKQSGHSMLSVLFVLEILLNRFRVMSIDENCFNSSTIYHEIELLYDYFDQCRDVSSEQKKSILQEFKKTAEQLLSLHCRYIREAVSNDADEKLITLANSIRNCPIKFNPIKFILCLKPKPLYVLCVAYQIIYDDYLAYMRFYNEIDLKKRSQYWDYLTPSLQNILDISDAKKKQKIIHELWTTVLQNQTDKKSTSTTADLSRYFYKAPKNVDDKPDTSHTPEIKKIDDPKHNSFECVLKFFERFSSGVKDTIIKDIPIQYLPYLPYPLTFPCFFKQARKANNETELRKAAGGGRLKEVKEIISRGKAANLNLCGQGGKYSLDSVCQRLFNCTALMLAVHGKHPEVVGYLINQLREARQLEGALKQVDYFNKTALDYAVESGDEKLVNLFFRIKDVPLYVVDKDKLEKFRGKHQQPRATA